VTKQPREGGGHSPRWAAQPEKKLIKMVLLARCNVCAGLIFKILQGSHIPFMCFVRISEKTATFALNDIGRLVLYDLGGKCLLRSTHYVLIQGDQKVSVHLMITIH
jgi:hypothetical protein